jgi:hypothetical protein
VRTYVAKSLTVALAVTRPRFLDGSHCVEFVWYPERYATGGDACYVKQIAVCVLRQRPSDDPFLVERYRTFGTKLTDPLPRWHAFFGSWGGGRDGFCGSCSLHLSELLRPARLVALARNDRVPPEEPAWDPYRNGSKPDRLARERAAFKAPEVLL